MPLYNFAIAQDLSLTPNFETAVNLQCGVRAKHYVHVEHETAVEEIRKVTT